MRYVKPLSLFQDVLMAHTKKKGRLLGLDVGDKYVGLAVSDSSNKIASPLRYCHSCALYRTLAKMNCSMSLSIPVHFTSIEIEHPNALRCMERKVVHRPVSLRSPYDSRPPLSNQMIELWII